jgi:hypothetical protein
VNRGEGARPFAGGAAERDRFFCFFLVDPLEQLVLGSEQVVDVPAA